MAQEKLQFKATSTMNAFNMLQDLRHLVILDFRSEEEYNAAHIRKAVRVNPESYKQMIASAIVSLHNKIPEKEKAEQNSEGEVPQKEISVDDAASRALKNLLCIEKGDLANVDGKSFASEYKQDDLKRVLMVFPEDSQQIK